MAVWHSPPSPPLPPPKKKKICILSIFFFLSLIPLSFCVKCLCLPHFRFISLSVSCVCLSVCLSLSLYHFLSHKRNHPPHLFLHSCLKYFPTALWYFSDHGCVMFFVEWESTSIFNSFTVMENLKANGLNSGSQTFPVKLRPCQADSE